MLNQKQKLSFRTLIYFVKYLLQVSVNIKRSNDKYNRTNNNYIKHSVAKYENDNDLVFTIYM